MANLKEESKWEDGVYQFETSDPVQGGPDGIDNVPTKQLANRTRHLKDRADGNDKRVGEVSAQVDALGKRTDALGNEKLPYTGGTLKGALLGKVGAITPNNANNAGFGFANDPDTGMFSPRDGYLQIGAQGVSHLEIQGNNCFVGPAVASGWLALISGGAERMRLTPGGRLLVGTTADNGRDGMQVAYRTSFANGVQITGMDSGDGGQLRACGGQYGVMFRHDDITAYWLQTKKGDPLGSWNDYRPFSWTLDTGAVSIDATGAGTYLGGSVNVVGDITLRPAWGEGRIRFGAVDGYFYANADNVGWYSATKGSFQYFFGSRTLRVDGQMVYHTGNLTPLDMNNGGTLKGALWLAAGARIYLSEGTPQNPSLTFDKDGAPDTGLYHITDGAFGVTCNGIVTARFTADKGTIFDRPVQVPTLAAGDRSNNAASTAYVVDAIASASIGQIIFEVRNSVRAGCLKLDGALLKRADYPQLWAYAQASGALATEKDWAAGWWGCFSIGDGETTFRIPEFRGEGVRCADGGRGVDSGRGVGSWQDSQNRSHSHGASSGAAGDHTHTAWTDAAGWHGHNITQQPHSHGFGLGSNGAYSTSTGRGYGMDNGRANNLGTDGATIPIGIDGNGQHTHAVGIGGVGGHSHAISVAADGGTEARMRNIAVLAMIRAY
ncbi:phage tail protein [Burkholderia cepacia]|uniref:phage tail protein n=1 Tax=Burkholderia cepacia TaxID=292 RepID=UPI00075E1818|nr:phage tail protein [Burkholderia cepacia]KVX55972.1 phage tail protein [Burkholderia cepacia]